MRARRAECRLGPHSVQGRLRASEHDLVERAARRRRTGPAGLRGDEELAVSGGAWGQGTGPPSDTERVFHSRPRSAFGCRSVRAGRAGNKRDLERAFCAALIGTS